MRQVRLPTLKKMLGDHVHAEVAKGTDLDNDKYCSKDSQIVVDIGQPSDQCSDHGETNLSFINACTVADKLAKGKRLVNILDSNPNYMEVSCKHARIIKEIARNQSIDQVLSLERQALGNPLLNPIPLRAPGRTHGVHALRISEHPAEPTKSRS